MSSADRVTYDKRVCGRSMCEVRVRMSTDGDAPRFRLLSSTVTLLRTSATLCSSGPHTRHVCVASKAVTLYKVARVQDW